jgi:hypothetical protein
MPRSAIRTCSAPSGPYSHVFVTVTDVKIHSTSNAGANDTGWMDLTPDSKNSPKQVDLLAQAGTECFLAMRGSKMEIQAGTYQQIRVFLATGQYFHLSNQCSSAAGNPANSRAESLFYYFRLEDQVLRIICCA